jgi:AcrR family transcriptional regulator
VPRVSEEHLAARRQQILEAARVCFVRNGFHATSMQEVIAEAGLSVGAIYRYFPSKTSLIIGIAEETAAQVSDRLARVVRARNLSLVDAMVLAAGLVDANSDDDGQLRLAVQLWSEAMRDPALAALARTIYAGILANYVAIARHAVERGDLPSHADPEGVGAVLGSSIIGYGIVRLLTGGPDLATYQAGLRATLTLPLRETARSTA